MKIITFLLVSLATFPCLAHDLVIERDATLHTLVYGHERSSHTGTSRVEYKPESVKDATCYDAAGKALKAAREPGYPATLRGDCAASVFLFSSGYWSKTPFGTKNLPKSAAGAVFESWLSLEGVKRIDRWGAALARPLGESLELVPLDNPLMLKTGDKLRLRVWLEGKPAPGVTVANFGKPRGISDADGNINIRLVNPGFQLVQASLQRRLDDPRADKAIHMANLHFELP